MNLPLRTLVAGLGVALCAYANPASAQSTGIVAGVVRDDANAPITGATVVVSGTAFGTQAKADGTYRLVLSSGDYTLVARLIGYTSAVKTVRVATGATVTVDFTLSKSAAQLSAVAVTGSRRQERSVVEAPVPVDVITAEDIKQTGRTETAQILQMLVPSLNFPRSSIAGGVDGQRPFTLRGMGPDQVLVLINGKRRHAGAVIAANNSVGRGSAGIDLNAIPASSIDRIEVLRDGAAAQYGSDAIAGVVNVILKQNAPATFSTTFGQVNSSYNETSYSDGGVTQADGSWSRGFRDRGYVNVSGEYRDRGLTNRAKPDLRAMYFNDDSVARVNPALLPQARNNSWYGDAALREGGLMLNSGYSTTAGITLYAFGGGTVRESKAFGFPRRPSERTVVRALYPNGFLPEIWGTSLDLSLTGGAKGQAKGWQWDLSSSFGGNNFRFDVKNSLNPTLGVNSPTEFYAGMLRSTQSTTNIDLSRAVNIAAFATPVNVAVGAEFRSDNYRILQGDSTSYIDGGVRVLDGPERGQLTVPGSQLFYGFRPVDERNVGRTSFAGYLDLEGNPTKRLTVGLAARGENFSDFGSAVIGKVTGRFAVGRGVAVRGAYNTGFRAPSLGQANYSATASNVLIVGGVPTTNEVYTVPVDLPVARALGAKPLEAEKSTNTSAGITWSPVRNFSTTVDYFNIEVVDRIVLSENFVGAGVRAIIEPFGLRGDVRPRYFTNAVDTRTRGVDVVLRYVRQLENDASLSTTFGYNHNRTSLQRVAAPPPQLAALNQQLYGRVERSRLTEAQPRNLARINIQYSKQAWSLNLQQAYFGGWWTRPDLALAPTVARASSDQYFTGRWITDASVTRRLDKSFSLSLGVDNLFDVYPDRISASNPENTGATRLFSPFSPFGANGRFLFARMVFTP
ncbi:TonB-dependent receptor [Gemmatimonas sp.]|uniref:TonB-dependent receptor n=1 Tax=Gemmatimonas sp. TaxID=1962908 RepID=UPI00286E83FB|nr:TonB-dependent receptor [Gemmatimonas sp.]